MSNDRKVFTDSVTPLPVETEAKPFGMMVNATEPHHQKEKMTVLFSLSIPPDKQADLEQRVAKGDVVPYDELKSGYAPNAADVKALTSWLAGQGFTIDHTSEDGTGVYAQASVEQIQKVLAVNMVRVTRDGITYTAAANAPSLPADVGRNVHAIIGLQPFRKARKHFRLTAPKHGNRSSLGHDELSAAPMATGEPSTNIANAPPYLVSEVLKAYGADSLKLTGKGQTIAILIDTFPSDQDLVSFWNRNGLTIDPKTKIQKINVGGGGLPVAEGEETLDTEWTSGVAPDATIRIYASGSLSFVALDKALDRIIADVPKVPGMRQLSISLGLGEQYMGGLQGEVATQHQKYLRLAALGVNVFVSSGDAGSNPDTSGHSANGPLQAEYASSDSCVVGVGGTRLRLAGDGSVTDESGWVSSGGGESMFFKRPTWQTGSGVPSGDWRLIPDVSAAADPNNGAFIIFRGKVVQIGGTSWSAPVWAGICALINEARADAGMPPLPFLNPILYGPSGTGCFRDIVDGSNGEYTAAQGYDMVTGLGVPNVEALVAALTKAPATAAADAATPNAPV